MTRLVSALARVAAGALDVLVAPAYGQLGYRLRAATWDDAELAVDLSHQRYLVTGANAGIGKATASALAARGATVYLACRDRAKGEQTVSELSRQSGNPRVQLVVMDVSVMADVQQAARHLASEPLHGLVHNAGVLLPSRQTTREGIERTFATNVLGPYLLTQLLRDALAKGAQGSGSAQGPARVVFVSSGGMYTQKLRVDDLQNQRGRWDGVMAYAQTKRAEILLCEHFAKELCGQNIRVNAMHPGWADTPGVMSSLPTFHKLLKGLLRDSAQGADTIVWLLASEAAAQHTGAFFLDRLARRTHLPFLATESSAEDVARLLSECEALLRSVLSTSA